MNNATAMAIHHLALKSSLPNWASQLNLFNVALRESIILRNLIQFNKYLKTSLHCYIALLILVFLEIRYAYCGLEVVVLSFQILFLE